MLDSLNSKIKETMKSKETKKLQALRYIKSLLIENSTAKKPIPEMDVLIKHHKKIQDSLELYPKESDQRNDLEVEISVLASFLPTPLTENEVKKMIEEVAKSQKQTHGNPNMGSLMKEISPKIKGKFNGKQASELIKDFLAN